MHQQENHLGVLLVSTSRSRTFIYSLVTLAASLLSGVQAADAQSGRVRQPAQPDPQAIRLRAEEVLVPVTIQSESGKLPDHMSPSDLIVAEDNARRTVTSLMRTPAGIVLILDNCIEFSGAKEINRNRDAALAIIESMGGADSATLITYADQVEVLCGWTSDKALLRESLTDKFKPGAKSHLYDSLVYAADELLAKSGGRHSIVLFTDGYDGSARKQEIGIFFF